MYSEHSVNLEPEGTHLSQDPGEEDAVEPECTVSSGTARVEISSTADIQEEAAKGDPGCNRASLLMNMLMYFVIHNSYFFHLASSRYANHA